MEFLIRKKRPAMAISTARLAVKQICTTSLFRRQRRFVSCQKRIKGRIIRSEFNGDEGSQRLANMGNGDLLGRVNIVKCFDKHLAIFRNDAHPLGEDRPDSVDPVMQGTGHLIFFWIAGHFKLCRHGKDSLCAQNSFEAMWQPFLGRCVEPVIEIICNRQPPVMKQDGEFLGRQIPQGAGIARHAFANPRLAGTRMTVRPNTYTAFTNAQR